MNPEVTLAGYMAKHERAAAFTGSDGQAYSCAVYVDEDADPAGRYGAALLFVRWSADGSVPVGHVETNYLAWGGTPDEAERRVGALSLYDVKAALDQSIGRQVASW
jgi:hypothetical protein